MTNIHEIAVEAKKASVITATLNTDLKNKVLNKIAEKLENNISKIIEANKRDLENSKKDLSEGKISQAVFNRIKADENKLSEMIQGIRDVAKLNDPVNRTLFSRELAKGLVLKKISCPIGVIGVIFEARPDVIAQISSLAIKSGNSVILKGGKETDTTNSVIFDLIREAISEFSDFPQNSINLIHSRDEVSQMLAEDKYIDLIIPRGSNNLVRYIQENTKIPVLGHASGICHIFIDEFADFEKALNITEDAKCQYPSACNAVETVLVHKNIADDFIPLFIDRMDKAGVKIHFENDVKEWAKEYGEKELSLKIVENINQAIEHINTFGSGHTDCIITENNDNAELFMNFVDSAGVYKNASTRFADGFRYGFGAEVGISTNKTHARGPVGLEGLTIYKYKLYGSGDTVGEFCSGKRKFTHKDL